MSQDDPCLYRLCREAKEAKVEEEERLATAPLKPGQSAEKYWLKPLIIPISTNTLTAMAVHGALCLALRHPNFRGRTRKFVIEFTKSLGEWLVTAGALAPEQLAAAEQLEAEEGSEDLQREVPVRIVRGEEG